jgi:predicted ATPase/DNA-binding winged helix-turn-helix (wHTH) protein
MLSENLASVYAAGECEIDLARRELRVLGSRVPVGGRAFEIIEVLAQSAGELVTKDELMSRIWPGAIVMDNTLQVHATAIRKALGPYRSLLKTEPGRGYRLLGNWTVRQQSPAAPPAGPRPAPATTPATNFPTPITRLVGRSATLRQLRDLLSACRIVTLAGPGGIGKTSIALKLGHRAAGEFADGAWLVELAPLSDPALVPSAVAHALGLKPDGEAISATAVAQSVGARNILLVLDNCEHLIDAAAQFVETIVRMCRGVTVLATSRELLRIDGEHVYRVPPLEVPAAGLDEPDHILGQSAVELFITRAAELGADFSASATVLPAIAAICRRLDGIPLAIEFAAARAASLGVDNVAAHLGDHFALLSSGHRTAVPRQRTLHATLDWSYQLLSDREQLLLRRLAIFPDGFSIDAAAAVMRDSGLGVPEVEDGIASLVAKSLVVPDPVGPGARWRLLATTRSHALEKLTEHD